MKRFIKKVLFFSTPIVFISIFACWIYYTGKEHYSIATVYKMQKDNSAILISKAYSNLGNEYAFYNIINQKPEVLILGASRVANLKPSDFSHSAYNANINLISMEYYYAFLQELKKYDALPKTLIFGVEQWLFNENFTDTNKDINSNIDSYLRVAEHQKHITLYAFQKIISDFFQGKIDLKKLCNSPHIGIAARMRNSGWDIHGSPYDESFIPLNKSAYKKEYHDTTLKQIKDNTGVYVWGDHLSEKTITFFQNIIHLCKTNDINLYVFLPPYSPEIFQEMTESNRYLYLVKMQTIFQEYADKYNFYFFDFTYMPDTKPENYSDGHHGDPFVYRIITDKILSVYSKQL